MKLIDFTPQRILLVRLSAIGDVVMASALIPALREAWPQARLVWLTEEANAGLLQDNPRLQRVIVWPRRRWRQLRKERRYLQWLRELSVLVGDLRRERFDLVLDLQGLLKSGIWARLCGSGARIGLGSREGSQWLMTRTLDTRTETPRIGGEYLKLARALGLQPRHFDMDIAVSAQAREQARELLEAAGAGGAYTVVCPFTTRPQKHWFTERWAELAQALASESGGPVVMLGAAADRVGAEAIAKRAAGIVDLSGRTSLGQCAAIIERAGLLIGVDTGLTHLGIAMKTPTLALFGSTRPYLDTDFELAKVLYEPMPCSPCKRRPICGGEFQCMQAHTVAKVLAEAALLRRPDR